MWRRPYFQKCVYEVYRHAGIGEGYFKERLNLHHFMSLSFNKFPIFWTYFTINYQIQDLNEWKATNLSSYLHYIDIFLPIINFNWKPSASKYKFIPHLYRHGGIPPGNTQIGVPSPKPARRCFCWKKVVKIY